MKITRTEGYKVLYRGMDLNLLVGVPMVSPNSYLLLVGGGDGRGGGDLVLGHC